MSTPDDDDVVEPAAARWWNQLHELERSFWLGASLSLDPVKAHAAYTRAMQGAEEARAASAAHQEVVAAARAKAAAVAAATLRGSNGHIAEQ